MTRLGTRRSFVSLSTTAAATACALIGASPYATADEQARCANSFFVVSGHALYQLDEQAGQARRVSQLGAQLNAIDYQQAQDRFLGIGSYPDGAHVVAARPNGAMADLGPVPNGTQDAYAGAISGDRWYLRGLGDLVIIDINPNSHDYLDVIARRPLSHPADLGDWAVNPADGLLYGIDATGPGPARLVSVDSGSGKVTVVGVSNLPGWRPYGGVVIDALGTLHALRNVDAACSTFRSALQTPPPRPTSA